MARPKARSRTPSKPGETSLRLRQPAEAIAALLRERHRLLLRIAKMQRDVLREREQQRTVGEILYERMQPLVSERSNLMEEINAIFQELFAEGRLARSARKKVTEIYDWLVENGDLEPPEPARGEPRSTADWDESEGASEPPGSQPQPGVASAKHAGGRPGNDVLRGLFRRLAMALHPDLAQQEHEQKRRTDVMKEVTRAYEEGNLARLLEIEQLWLSGGEVRSAESDEAARCAELERTIRELEGQLKASSGELRELRRSSPLAQMFGTRRVSEAVRRQQLEILLNAASAELDPLRRLRDFVRAFSKRKISLAEFLRGPEVLYPDHIDLNAMMVEFMAEELGIDPSDIGPPRSRRGRSRGSSKRSKIDFEGIPF